MLKRRIFIIISLFMITLFIVIKCSSVSSAITWQFGYDNENLINKIVLPGNKEIVLKREFDEHDYLKKLIQINDKDKVKFDFDKGNLIKMQDSLGELAYSRDDFGRLNKIESRGIVRSQFSSRWDYGIIPYTIASNHPKKSEIETLTSCLSR